MDRSELTGSPDFVRLHELEVQLQVVQEHIARGGFVSSEIRGLYEQAHTELTGQIQEVGASANLQDLYARLGNDGVLGHEQIARLDGVLPEEQLDVVRQTHTQDISDAVSFYNTYPATTEEAKKFVHTANRLGHTMLLSEVETRAISIKNETEVSEESEDTTPVSEPMAEAQTAETPTDSGSVHEQITERRPSSATPSELRARRQWEDAKQERLDGPLDLAITIGASHVRIGSQGKVVALSSRSHEGQADYTTQRRNALLYMIETQTSEGREVTPYELWAVISPDDRAIDKAALGNIRTWLLKLTYRNRPLVVFNGMRGSSSRYMVSRAFTLKTNLPLAEMSSTEQLLAEDSEDEIDEENTPYGIRNSDFYIAASQLAHFNQILEESGVKPISREMVDELSKYEPDWSHLRGDDEAINQARQKAIERMLGLLSDEDKFFAFIESVSKSSTRLSFIEVLSEVEDEQRRLIERLMTSHWTAGVGVDRRRGQIILAAEGSCVVDKNGDPIYPLFQYQNRSADEVIEDGDIIDDPEEGQLDDPEQDTAADVEVTAEEQTVETLEQVLKSSRSGKREKEVPAIIIEKIKAYAATWSRVGLDIDSAYTRTHLCSVFNTHLFSRRNMKMVVGGRVASERLGFRDSIEILIKGEGGTKHLYKANKKEVTKLIEEEKDLARQKQEEERRQAAG